MKSKLLALAILLTPFGANALGWQGNAFQSSELKNMTECAPRTCALGDLATTYGRVCDQLHDFYRHSIVQRPTPVMQVINSSNHKSCVCICDMDRIAEARKAAVSSGATGLEN